MEATSEAETKMGNIHNFLLAITSSTFPRQMPLIFEEIAIQDRIGPESAEFFFFVSIMESFACPG